MYVTTYFERSMLLSSGKIIFCYLTWERQHGKNAHTNVHTKKFFKYICIYILKNYFVMTMQKKNLQVGVIATGVILCLNDSIGEVGEAMGEFIGKNVILGLGLCIGRKGEDGIDGGRDELFEDEKEVAGDIVLRLADQHKGVAI